MEGGGGGGVDVAVGSVLISHLNHLTSGIGVIMKTAP